MTILLISIALLLGGVTYVLGQRAAWSWPMGWWGRRPQRWFCWIAVALLNVAIVGTLIVRPYRVIYWMPGPAYAAIEIGLWLWMACSMGMGVGWFVSDVILRRKAITSSRRGLIRFTIGGLAGVATAAIISYGLVGPANEIRLEDHAVACPTLKADREVRVVEICDMHSGVYLRQSMWEDAVDMAIRCKPDLIVLAGDFVSQDAANIRRLEPGLRRLSDTAPVFAVLGNHDVRLGVKTIVDSLRGCGAAVLRDQNTTVDVCGTTIRIIGMRDLRTEQPNWNKALKGVQREEFRLAIAHHPDTLMKMIWNPSLLRPRVMLAAHTHGGQIVLPFIGPLGRVSSYGYYSGFFDVKGVTLYVNRGLGVGTPPIRINCPPEVTLMRLQPAPAEGSP